MSKLPPLDFLLVCSDVSLRDFELSRLNEAANVRKNLIDILDRLVQVEAEARFARWLIEHRHELVSIGRARELQTAFEFHPQLSLPAARGPRRSTGSTERENYGSAGSRKGRSRIAAAGEIAS